MAKNRADLINKTYKVLKKHYKPVASPDHSALECLLFACLLENTPYDKAEAAFARIREISSDWNEVRVTAVLELAESLKGFPDARRSASNLRRVLHSVFESQYSYDLEHLKKQNLGKTIKDLEKHAGSTPFIVSYFTQNSLAGHSIPVDRGALDVMYIVGVIDEKEREKAAVPGLERAIPKKQGVEFGSLLHQLAADLVASPFSQNVRGILLEIAPDCKDRLPKRKSKKKAAPPKEEPKAKAAKKTDTKKTPAKKAATKRRPRPRRLRRRLLPKKPRKRRR